MKTNFKLKTIVVAFFLGGMLFGNAQVNARKGWDGVVKGKATKQEISCPDGSTMTNGKCVPNELLKAKWLDLETGQIKYFEYTQDTPIDNPAICKALGVETCVILKGRYMVDRSDDSGGKMTLRIAPIKWINRPPIPESRAFAFEGTNPKGQNCSGFGNSCFYAVPTQEDAKAGMKLPYFITPIITQEVCRSIEVQWKGVDPRNPGF